MSEELKPCPFCGGEAEEQFEDAGTVHPSQTERSSVYCPKCDALINGGELEETRKAWNTRPAADNGELVAAVMECEALDMGDYVEINLSKWEAVEAALVEAIQTKQESE